MTMITRRLGCAALAGLALLATQAGARAADVKIGFLGGFTGPIESLVPPIHDAAALAVKHVDDQGGILDGRKLVMVQGDFELCRRHRRRQRRRPDGQCREGGGAGRAAVLRRDDRGRQQRGDPRRRGHRVAGSHLAAS